MPTHLQQGRGYEPWAGGVQGQRTSLELQLDCMRTYCIRIDTAEWRLVSFHILIKEGAQKWILYGVAK
jgi:hypothetical protein